MSIIYQHADVVAVSSASLLGPYSPSKVIAMPAAVLCSSSGEYQVLL